MSAVANKRPPYSQTKGYHWPISFDPTSAFVKKEHGSSKRTTGGSVDGSVMDVDTPGAGGSTSREGSVRPGESTHDPSQTNITMPLLHAIRTTANHVQRRNLPPAGRGAGTSSGTAPKRVVRSAMALGTAPPPAPPPSTVPVSAFASISDLTKLSIPSTSFSNSLTAVANSPVAGLGSPLVLTGAVSHRAVGTPGPGTRASTPSSGVDAGTPITAGVPPRKKKKKGVWMILSMIARSVEAADFLRLASFLVGTKDTPSAAQSPQLPSV